MSHIHTLGKIVSGGQTGADRAALDWAMANGVAHGGWCPKGRRAEDGPLSPRYRLDETPTYFYEQRTEWNARDADGTVVITLADKLQGGSALTAAMARKHKKPCLHLSRAGFGGNLTAVAGALRRFVLEQNVRTLNVAGPRATTEPDIYAWVTAVLDAAFGEGDSNRQGAKDAKGEEGEESGAGLEVGAASP
jgi:hypothetical protein